MFNNNLIYFVKYSLDLHAYQGLILGVSSGAALLAIPFWAFAALKRPVAPINKAQTAIVLIVFGAPMARAEAEISPRRPTHFLLPRQKKVSQEKYRFKKFKQTQVWLRTNEHYC